MISGNRFVAENMCKIFNIPMQKVSEYLLAALPEFQKGKISHEEFWVRFKDISGLKLPENYLDLWTTDFHKESHVTPDMHELLDELKSKGVTIVMHSNTIPPHAEFMWRTGVFKKFDVVFNSCDIGERKPEPAFYTELFKKLNAKPEELLYVEDNLDFMVYQKEIGLNVIQYKSVKQLREELKNYGVL